MEEFGKNLEDFKPDLMVVGGLQMMDNFPFQSGKHIHSLTQTHTMQKWKYPSSWLH